MNIGQRLTGTDERRLVGVNKDLVALVRRVALVTPAPFLVVEGLRTKARQRELYALKATKTLNSKHIIGRAVDCAPLSVLGKEPWPWDDFTPLVECAKACARDMGLRVTFGYDWGWDAPHWEMTDG